MGVTTMDDINGVTDDPRDTEIFIAGMSYWTSHADLDTFNSDTLINSLVSMTPNHEPHLWSPNLAPCFDHFKRHVCTCNIPDCTVSIHIATDIGAYIEHSRNAKAYFNHTPEGATARIMVRQAESVFNLSQLMFALYHGQSRASTFRDLNAPDHRIVTDQPQDRKLIHAGFDKIKGEQSIHHESRRALHELCCEIFESGGLEVIFSMFEFDHMKIIKQKCLDALTNILCVPVIEEFVLMRKSWFLTDIIRLINTGRIVNKTEVEKLRQDVVPSISVLDRLIVVILSNNLEHQYQKVMQEKCIEACLDSLENDLHKNFGNGRTSPNRPQESALLDEYKAHFVKFETIAMQAISLLFHDHRSAAWDVRLGKRVIRHCLRILTRWREKSTARAGQQQQVSSFRTSALLFTLTVIVKVSNFDDDKELFKYANKCLREDNLLLHLIMPLSTVQIDDDGCRFIAYSKKAFEMCGNQANWPRQAESILNSLTWLYQRHYRHHQAPAPYTDLVPGSIDNPLRELSERVYRRCSSKHCHVIESKHRRFDQECVKCRVTIYCSERCQAMHYPAHQHLCTFLARWTLNQPMALVTSTTVGDSSCDVKRKRAPLLTLNHYPMKLRSANKRRSSQPTIQT